MIGRTSFETSQIRIIGLDEIKRIAGEGWGRLSARVRQHSKHFIEHRLERDDILIPAGDGFVVVYASPEHAGAKSAALQHALNLFYLGEDGMRTLHVEVYAQTIAIEQILDVLPPALSQAAPARPFSEAPPGVSAGAVRTSVPYDEMEDDGAGAELAVLPVWSVGQQAVTGYWISPVHRGGGVSRYGYDKAWRDLGTHRAEDFLATDLAILDQVVAFARQCLKAQRPCLIGYSVHATTMHHPKRRQAFLKQLHTIPPVLRPYLLGRIAEITPGTPKSAIADWAQMLRSITQRVTIELHASEQVSGGWSDLGIFSVAFVAPAMPAWGQKMDRFVRLIQTWRPVLQRDGLKFRVDVLARPELLAQAVENGIDLCTSELLWPGVAAPDGIKPFSTAQFEAGLQRSRQTQRA